MLPPSFPSGEHTLSGFQNIKINITIHLNKPKQFQPWTHRVYSKPSFGEILVSFFFILLVFLFPASWRSLRPPPYPYLPNHLHFIPLLTRSFIQFANIYWIRLVLLEIQWRGNSDWVLPLQSFQAHGPVWNKHDPNDLTNGDKSNIEKK